MESLTRHLDRLTNAASVEDLWTLHQARMAEYGFDRLLYGFTRYRSGNSLGDPQDWVVLSNHTAEYIDTFVRDGHYYHAPMLRWSLENDGASSWRWIEQALRRGEFTAAEARVIDYNRRMGVTAGYTISFRSLSARAKGAIGLTVPAGQTQEHADAIWERHGEEIVVTNNVAHLKILSLPHMRARQLTRRQREVLEWVGDGKTTQDIATIMGLTPATVEKHLRLAREALDVDTTAQAVLKAAVSNQMFVLDA